MAKAVFVLRHYRSLKVSGDGLWLTTSSSSLQHRHQVGRGHWTVNNILNLSLHQCLYLSRNKQQHFAVINDNLNYDLDEKILK